MTSEESFSPLKMSSERLNRRLSISFPGGASLLMVVGAILLDWNVNDTDDLFRFVMRPDSIS
jgi:hypothetical protein